MFSLLCNQGGLLYAASWLVVVRGLLFMRCDEVRVSGGCCLLPIVCCVLVGACCLLYDVCCLVRVRGCALFRCGLFVVLLVVCLFMFMVC